MSSIGAVGVGTGAILVAPLLMAAGQWMIGGGLVVAGISAYVNACVDEMDIEGGEKLGLMIAAYGAVVAGAGYVLLAVGGIAVAAGAGGCVLVGARMGIRYSRMKRCEVKVPLLVEGGE
jgi:hypothetical protein